MIDHTQSPYLTDVQLAEYLNISTSMVRQWRIKKVGPVYTKIGHSVRYHVDDINEYLKSRLVEHIEKPIVDETVQ